MRLLTVLCALTFSLTAPPSMYAQDTSERAIRVMTYNIHHGRGMDGELDLERLARVIIDSGASVVALQEVDVGVRRSDRRDLVQELSALADLPHSAFGKNLDFDGGDYGNAVLSAHPILEHRNTHLPLIDGREQRGVQEVVIDIDGTPLVLLNTHLDHSPDDDGRRQEIRVILDEILPGHATGCLILAADLNDTPDGAIAARVREDLTDSWLAVGSGDGDTFPADAPDRRIDYVFSGDSLVPLSAHVPETMASDHRPVVVEFAACNPGPSGASLP